MEQINKEKEKIVQNEGYPSADVVFEVLQKEYEYELNRATKLDSKINMAITLCGVLFLFVIGYLNFENILDSIKINVNSSSLLITGIVCFIGSALIVCFFVYAIMQIISLLKIRAYHHINCDSLFDLNIVKDKKEVAKHALAVDYNDCISKNNATNDKRSKGYNRAIVALEIMIGICIFVEFLKMNFLNMKGG